MSGNPNKLSQFWQELKRRNVARVLAVYIAASFMILELISMFSEQIGLPDGTWKVAFIISLAGLVIAVIISWIYDVHPEEGIVKTEPSADFSKETVRPSFQSWKIASYISFVVIVGLIVLNVITRIRKEAVLEFHDKSIAVLPFRNDSPDQEMYFINGTMEEILHNLCKIKDLRVVSRNSVEQYRGNPKPTPVVAQEMNVSYVLEGSGQRDGEHIRLTVQLLDANKDQHIWSESFYRELKNIFDLQSDIAQLVAAEINAAITPDEKERIEKKPTTSLTAFDLFIQGWEEHKKYWNNSGDREALNRAEQLYRSALDYDSTYAQAYSGLAWVYFNKNYWDAYYVENALDSALILADKAISFDPQLSEAYIVRGYYFNANGDREQAIKEFDRAIKYNPNDWSAYQGKLRVYSANEILLALQNGVIAVSLNRGPELPGLLRTIGWQLTYAGFQEQARNYISNAVSLDGDSSQYFYQLASTVDTEKGIYSIQSLEWLNRAYTFDPNNANISWQLIQNYQFLGQFEKALFYCEKYIERMKSLGHLSLHVSLRIAYTYSKVGDHKSADYYFKQQLEYCDAVINRRSGIELYRAYYSRAAVNAYVGNKKQAISDLEQVNQIEKIAKWAVFLLNYDPLLDNIRDEPEFQQIARDIEAKYQAEHERVRQWLEENDML